MINPLEFSEREEVISMSFIEIKVLSKIFLQGNQKIYGIRNANLSIEKGILRVCKPAQIASMPELCNSSCL